MSLISHLIKLNELQVNGQTVDDNDDFNVGEETPTNAEAQAESPADVAQNDAENQTQEEPEAPETGAADEPAPQADTTTTEDQEDDFTLTDTEEPAPAEETPTQAEETPAADDTTTGGEAAPEDPEGDDNFTVDGGEEPAEDGGEAPAEGGEQQPEQHPAKELPKDPTDAISDDDDRAAEEAIYDSLTDDQKRIRVLQLKLNYKDLYETMSNTLEGINNIPKNADNLETIKRLTLLINKAKNILIDYVENNFDSSPYLENYTVYMKYIAVFRTASKVIEELNASKD